MALKAYGRGQFCQDGKAHKDAKFAMNISNMHDITLKLPNLLYNSFFTLSSPPFFPTILRSHR